MVHGRAFGTDPKFNDQLDVPGRRRTGSRRADADRRDRQEHGGGDLRTLLSLGIAVLVATLIGLALASENEEVTAEEIADAFEGRLEE